MSSKFKLIQTVDAQVKLNEAEAIKQAELNVAIRESFESLAAEHKTTGTELYEAVTHVLANIAAAALDGQPIKAMNAATLASFMAGVDHISNVLPKANADQKANALRVLQAASIGPDGLITTQCAPIAQMGAKQLETNLRYGELIKAYIASVNAKKPDGAQLAQAARQLQGRIDQAMRAPAPAPVKYQMTRAPGLSQPRTA